MAQRPTIRETIRQTNRETIRETDGEASRAAGVAPPRGTAVRRMSRVQFDRLSEERHWPRGDYDARRGVAEVVAEPTFAHEWRAGEVGFFVFALLGERVVPAGAIRIEWRGSVMEPDASFYFLASGAGPGSESCLEPGVEAAAAPGFGADDSCRPEQGQAPPPLVVEINRSSSPARAAEKRRDYLEMGVQEIWVWRPRGGASIYRRGEGGRAETVPESRMLPGVTREDLEALWTEAAWGESGRQRAAVIRRVRERVGALVSRAGTPGGAPEDEDG